MSDVVWRALFDDALARVHAGALSPVQIESLTGALLALDARVADREVELVRDAARKLADLEELYNANRRVTVGTLTVSMAHELGTPLGVVLARAQMIVTDETDLEEARNDAREIVVQVKRMTQMCREVLEFARPKPAAKAGVDMVALCKQMVALLLPDARKRSARLLFVGDPAPSVVLGDASKLMQIITNLIINAAQAMPLGGVVTVRVEHAVLQPPAVAQLPEREYLCVHVTDTGTGIRAADLGHIFETFFTTKAGEGTGLGLAISSRIAREHRGFINVETAEGHGSTFTLCLPPLLPSDA